ncbi:MAG: prepilin-type N-terminal cleavage/methylation domain-containing protein [Nitrospirae bacterium]|nr:prepilin-type N-terminal cleavage/methylation domain-containing protein [Nitrospirota bacterium]
MTFKRKTLSFRLRSIFPKSKIQNPEAGFTLLELIVVMLLITLILALSTAFFANTLPSSKFNAAVREMTTTIRQASHLAQSKGKMQTIVINLDSGVYGIEGRGQKDIPHGTNIKVLDALTGEVISGEYRLVFYDTGAAEGGTVVLWNEKKRVNINLDPVMGAVITE